MQTVDWLLEQLSPSRCLACDAEVTMRTAFCAACVATIERSGTANAPFLYGGAIAHALSRLKYEGRRELGPVLGRLLVLGLGDLPAVDVVAPVPLHASKLVVRGYNQSMWLSRAVARERGVAHDALLLRRTREAPAQVHHGVREREKNVLDAFAVRSPRQVVGRTVMIVDDVRTTGATLGACEMAVRAAGAVRVVTVSLCVTPREDIERSMHPSAHGTPGFTQHPTV
jgi:ComF family protein